MAIATGTALALGAAAAAGTAGGLYGSHLASNQASRSRQSAQQSFDYAQRFRPDFGFFNQQYGNGSPLFNQLAQDQAANSLRKSFGKTTEKGRQQVNESSASRGLFRSGIAAQQEGQYLSDQGANLANALQQQQLGFAQANADEIFRNRQLALSGQSDLYRTLLNYAAGQAGAAGQQQTAASQALGGAIQAPASLIGQYALLRSMGGMGGGQPGGGMLPSSQFGFQYPPVSGGQFGYPQPQYGF